MAEGSSSDILLGFLLGAATGAVAALLLAPRSGEQTRKRLADWLEENRGKTKEFLEKEGEKLHHAKDRISSAVEAAKSAYREADR
jgi:gas vesicle protein